MKNTRPLFSIILSILFFSVGTISVLAQNKPAAPIFDKASAARLSIEMKLLGGEVSLHGGSSIYKMDSTAIASAATGEYATFISKVLEGIKFEYSSPKYLSPVAVKYSGADCLVFRFSTSSVFNENKFSDRELAQRICSEKILPAFYDMSDSFEETCPKYVGIGVAYQTKDFTEKYSLGDSHSLIIISSKENIKKLFSYEVTDNKFLENCFILLYKESDGKRIELKL